MVSSSIDRPDRDGAVRALVSIHDLMPETLSAVRRLLDRLPAPAPITLLVVPGRGWDAAGIAALRDLQRAGYPLAGHGWRHHCDRITRFGHRLHSALISRRVAEHLALDAAGIVALVNRCHGWFREQDLLPPTLYVPPAWALGPITPARLAADCPFARYEVFSGVLEPARGRVIRLPLLGYEADTRTRVPAIALWNALNRAAARRVGWLRIGIHPFDGDLHLRAALLADLARYRRLGDYADVSVWADAQ